MKKTVILILALLPIVLVITISLAGRILSMYHHIPVEKVDFIDDLGDALDDEYLFIVNIGETKPTSVRIFPEMASNKLVSYASHDESLCTVDTEGNVTGVAIGSTYIIVTSSEGNHIDILNVLIISERVTGISLPTAELTLMLGEEKQLQPIIEPYTALNKMVRFESSDGTVASVKQNGYVTALKAGETLITVTSQDGGFSATCKVTVIDGLPSLFFDMTGAPNILPTASGTGYVINSNSIDLSPYLRYDESIDPATVRWRISSGNNISTLDGTTLTFTAEKTSIVTVNVFVGDPNDPTHEAKLILLYQP